MRYSDITGQLNEIEIGGHVEPDTLTDLQDQDYEPRQLSLFPDIPAEPNLKNGLELAGRMGEYYVVKRKEEDGYTVFLFSSGRPISYISLLNVSASFGGGYNVQNPPVTGKGYRVISVYIDETMRGNNIAIELYHWLLHNFCDYLLPDDLQTRGGVSIWRRMINDHRFAVGCYNPNKYYDNVYRVTKQVTWNNVYRSESLRPFVVPSERYDELVKED